MNSLSKIFLYISFIILAACGGASESESTNKVTTLGKKTEHPNNKETGSGKNKGSKPVEEEPVAEEPVVEEPVVEEPVVEEPVVEEPVVEEPVAEEPVAEEPVAEEPVAEEPVAEEPVAEEPVAEEPVVEDPVEDFTQQALTLRWNPTYLDELGNVVHKLEIETYTINWGNEENTLTEVIEIENVGADFYVFNAQAIGDYYFTISVESIYGTNSQASNVVYKQVN